MANRGKLIDSKSVINELSKEFDVYGLLNKIIYNCPNIKTQNNRNILLNSKEGDKKDSEELWLLKLKQFNLWKEFIILNSIPLELHHNQTEPKENGKN